MFMKNSLNSNSFFDSYSLIFVFTASNNTNNSLPANRVWSEEHGHWHDVNTPHAKNSMKRPLGAAPKGKVWSEQHGHWHDVAPIKR